MLASPTSGLVSQHTTKAHDDAHIWHQVTDPQVQATGPYWATHLHLGRRGLYRAIRANETLVGRLELARSWAASSWTAGKVTLAEAFGLSRKQNAQFQFPQLNATLPSDYAQTMGGSVSTNSKTYSQAQLQDLWVQAGGNPAKAQIASAIAMAESGGKTNATDNDSNGSVDRGLWQINSVHGALSTYSPLANARAAVQLSANGTNWSPWVTFTSGAYLKYM